MKRILGFMMAALIAAVVSFDVCAQEAPGTEAEAMAMVRKAVEYYKKNGREKTIAELVKSPGPFVDRDLYVTVYTLQGVLIAHINPKMVGKDLLEMRDVDGKSFVKERMEAARQARSGWQEYKFFNPVSRKVEPK